MKHFSYLMKIKCLIVLSFLIIVGLSVCNYRQNYIDPIYQKIDVIDIIYVTYISPTISPYTTIRECKIDFNSKQLLYFFLELEPNPNEPIENYYILRDELIENKEFVLLNNLGDDAIRNFLFDAEKARFVDWEEYYHAKATDWPSCVITIEFSDKTCKDIYRFRKLS